MKNRIIKFRAWDEETKTMFEPHEINFTKKGITARGIGHRKTSRVTLIQFTGMFDKNKKEIYHGDILKTQNGTVTQIVWNEERNGWDWFFVGFDTMMNQPEQWEVIGNIYQNPLK